MNKECLTWEKGKMEGEKRNLKLSDTCPLVELCKGTSCAFLDQKPEAKPYIDKFYDKREDERGVGR